MLKCSVIILSIALVALAIAYLFLKLYFRDTRALLGENRSLFSWLCSTNKSLHLFKIVLDLRRRKDVYLAVRLRGDVRHLDVLLVHLPITPQEHAHLSLKVLL